LANIDFACSGSCHGGGREGVGLKDEAMLAWPSAQETGGH